MSVSSGSMTTPTKIRRLLKIAALCAALVSCSPPPSTGDDPLTIPWLTATTNAAPTICDAGLTNAETGPTANPTSDSRLTESTSPVDTSIVTGHDMDTVLAAYRVSGWSISGTTATCDGNDYYNATGEMGDSVQGWRRFWASQDDHMWYETCVHSYADLPYGPEDLTAQGVELTAIEQNAQRLTCGPYQFPT